MAYQVLFYNPLAESGRGWRDLDGKQPLPKGACFICGPDSIPHFETTLFLAKVAKKCSRKRKVRDTGNTPHTYASQLKPYLELLDWYGCEWKEADPEVLLAYIDHLLDRKHWFTGEPLDSRTIEQRLSVVLRAITYTNKQGLTDIEFDREELLAELWEGLGLEGGSAGEGPRAERRRQVRSINDDDWDLIKAELGPSPDERTATERRPMRNRLLAELAITTGMRSCELAGLPVDLFQKVQIDDDNLDGWTVLHLSITKGMQARNVFVPNRLVRHIQIYAASERLQAEELGATFGNTPAETLFVNGVEAGFNAGKALRASAISDAFRQAVRAAGLTTAIRLVDESGPFDYKLARYRFHDLRHSYAVRLHSKLVGMGKYPWDIIQARLGHKDVETTKQVYCDLGNTLEPFVSDLVETGVVALIYA